MIMNTLSKALIIILALAVSAAAFVIIKNKKSGKNCAGCMGNCNECKFNSENFKNSIDK